MKNLYLLFVAGCCSAQQAEGTNPLANVLPAPVEQPTIQNIDDQPSVGNTTEIELSQNYKDYLREKENPNPLESFENNKVKFNDYDTNPVAVTNESSIDKTSSDESFKIFGMLFGLLCVFITFITLLFSRRNKKF